MSHNEDHDLSSFGNANRKLPKKKDPRWEPTPKAIEGKTHVTVAPTRVLQATSTPTPSPQATPTPTPSPLAEKARSKPLGAAAPVIIHGDTKSGQRIGSEGAYLSYDSSIKRGEASKTGTTIGEGGKVKQPRRFQKMRPKQSRRSGSR